ncbi:MAG: BrnA antitoxin family protein [Gammaproteobacteria bacterium]|nr:BrnA antitoxin family protein [Gammaproteobacteria bacterium]
MSLTTKRGRVVEMPTAADDADITAAAMVDPDNAPLSDAEWQRLRPTVKRGRPRAANPATPVSIRLPQELLARYKAGGAGWQTRMVAALESFASEHPEALASKKR